MDTIKIRVISLIDRWHSCLFYADLWVYYLIVHLLLGQLIVAILSSEPYNWDYDLHLRWPLAIFYTPLGITILMRYLQREVTTLNIIKNPALCAMVVAYCSPYLWRVKESKKSCLASSEYWEKMQSIRDKLDLKEYGFKGDIHNKNEIESFKDDIIVRIILADLLPKHKINRWFFQIRVSVNRKK